MASSQDIVEQDKKSEEADPSTYREREDAGPIGVKQTVETAARLYYEFCKKAARTINRLKREDE
ncbi:MAG: hypothetical protein ACQEVA_18470 [Myxococcota bacterium]